MQRNIYMNMVKTKNFLRISLLLIAVLSLILKAEGIGILSSGDMSIIDFQPNAKLTLPFGVRSNMAVPMNVELSVSGDLSKYAQLSEDNIFLNPQETKYFTVTVNFPSDIDVPGDHLLWVRALEEPSGGTISVRSAVNTWVKIKVPYPGKYVITSFDAPDVNIDEIVKFSVTINNLGKEDIKKAKAKIDIFGPDEDDIDKYISTIYTEEKPVPPKSTETLEVSLDTAGYKPGEYRAVAAISYDENQTAIEKYFKIGYLHVKIFNYTSEFKPNKIQKFDIGVESAWNNRIEDVYVEVRIMEDDNMIADLKTPSFPLAPWEKKIASAYWDTIGLAQKEYNAVIIANYEGRTTEEKAILNIAAEKLAPFSKTTIILVAVIALLVVGDIILVARRKKLKESQAKPAAKQKKKK